MEDRIKELEALVSDLSAVAANSFYETVQVLSAVVASLERYYEGSHSRFVSSKSEQIASLLGLNEADTAEIKFAALLHDVGKVGLSEPILSKFSSELQGHEYAQYILHPKLSKEILKKYKSFENIAEIAYQHHERIDGSGFPRNLIGNEIHIGAQIIAVVDAYHNIFYKLHRDRNTTKSSSIQYSSSAAYMESSQNKFSSAMNYLYWKTGTLFNKKVVETFTNIIDAERRALGKRIILRLPVNKLEPGMVFAEDYFTAFGMLIAARGEQASEDNLPALIRFAEAGEIPMKILVFR